MAETIRKQLVIKLLEEDNLSVKEIAEKADCTVGYVYNIRCEVGLRKLEAKKAKEIMTKVNKQIDSIVKPKAFSDNWEPKWWQMLLMAIVTWIVLYFFLVVAMSF
jgi:predicted DNA-binding protein YlxM (UPF0122 family)